MLLLPPGTPWISSGRGSWASRGQLSRVLGPAFLGSDADGQDKEKR
jgi:hypothetical protein